jgi:hypothetical protein
MRERPPVYLWCRLIESWVIGQHIHWSGVRSGDGKQRFRITQDTGGWVRLRNPTRGGFAPTSDRLATLCFLDLRKPGAGKSAIASAISFIGEHDGCKEYWISGPTFKKVAGGAREDRALKQQLFDRGLIATDRRGDRVSYVVKRALQGGSRPNLVVLRQKARHPGIENRRQRRQEHRAAVVARFRS